MIINLHTFPKKKKKIAQTIKTEQCSFHLCYLLLVRIVSACQAQCSQTSCVRVIQYSVSAKKAYNPFKGSWRITAIFFFTTARHEETSMLHPLAPVQILYMWKVDYFLPNTVWKVCYKLTVLGGNLHPHPSHLFIISATLLVCETHLWFPHHVLFDSDQC